MQPPAAAPRIVAIVGGSGSGKTTLARAVCRVLGEDSVLVEHDAYYRCLAHLPHTQRAAVNFDHPDSLENELLMVQLEQLRRGQGVMMPRYDFASHSRMPDGIRIDPRPVIVVEGILVLALPHLQRAFDLSVFVDTPTELRFRRRCDRDVRDRGRTPESVRSQWMSTVQPMHERFVAPSRDRCDLVLSGRDDVMQSARRVVACLQAQQRRDGDRPQAVGI
ncbi:MAG: hypothetical protein RL398_1700 [Planctomycetota bacterium]|jgi:uridine kinase